MKKLRAIIVLFVLCICMISPIRRVEADGPSATEPTTGAHGSGSYQLNSEGEHSRFYTEYFVDADPSKSISTAGIDRRTSIKVYAKKDEIILFGSSVSNSKIDIDNNSTNSVTGVDIVITTPQGQKIPKNVLAPGEYDDIAGQVRSNGLGYIKNPTQEKNGPMVNHANESSTDYYVPLQYLVPEDGVYIFEFHSVTGYNPKNGSGYHPTAKKAKEDWAQGNTAVAAWDVTVLGKKTATEWEVKSGRAWADYLALTTGGSNAQSDLNVHVLTHDGYQYKVNFEEAAPYGFIFFANNTGFMSATTDTTGETTYHPIYHSFYDSSNDLDGMANEKVFLHKPDEKDTNTIETYKIFFNQPNSDLDGISYTRYSKDDATGVLDTIKTQPASSVFIQDLLFTGVSGTGNIARAGQGGFFTFHASGEAMVTIRLDLRKAIFESEGTMDSYEGSGLVEITTPVFETTLDPTDHDDVNRVYWDGRDTDGVKIPAGIYGDSNVVVSTEIKRGELHFPVIDMEGLYGGLKVERMNGTDPDLLTTKRYDLYYNNNPLAYGTIEGKDFTRKSAGANYYALSDGTLSYKLYTDMVLPNYFNSVADNISTLKKDDKEYLSQKLFGTSYSALVDPKKIAIIDAEFEKEQATFHFEPVNSSVVSMKFKAAGNDGGGNRAGIDAWTYYSSAITSSVISFAVMDSDYRGMVKGQIFYDVHGASGLPNSVYNPLEGDYPLAGIKVRLIDATGMPLTHAETLPCFDDTGRFQYNPDGSVKHDTVTVDYEAVTDSTGTYRFTNVPYSDAPTTYYVQVMLTDVQSEVLRYTCTTSVNVQNNFTKSNGDAFLTASIDKSEYGADGNVICEAVDNDGNWDPLKIYRHRYDRNANHETIFVGNTFKDDTDYAQSVTFLPGDVINPGELVKIKEFKRIGFSSTVPVEHQKDYKVVKNWVADSQGNIHKISDGLIVELWVWNDDKVQEVNTHDLTRRTGALVDTQVLTEDNSWTHIWYDLDDRFQYYVLEYYTKKKPDGEVIYNDRGEPRKVLIGGTMPIFGADSSLPVGPQIYGFSVQAGDYPETIDIGGGVLKIPIQQFGDGQIHSNALTDKEKLESVDNNARQYKVTYTLTKEDMDKTNVITITNGQVYDDRAYYVWLGHETELPEMVALTYVDNVSGIKKSHAVDLELDDKHPLDGGAFAIKGLSITSIDGATEADNAEGNATSDFRVKTAGNKYAFYTATSTGNYTNGTGTRTYRVKYVVRASDKSPVSVTTVTSTDAYGVTTVELVETDTGKKVEQLPEFIVNSWYMTIHVYNVQADGPFLYDPNGGTVVLQTALTAGDELTWYYLNAGSDSEKYTSSDSRTGGLLANDTYRVPLYRHAEHPDMGTCADIVAVADAGANPVVDFSQLVYSDTYESKYGSQSVGADGELSAVKADGKAVVNGSTGVVKVDLNVQRGSRIDRVQDHANYAQVTFTPNPGAASEEVFYYKVVVFAEDNLYRYATYDEIDASDGVVMYTYFTMKPTPTGDNGGTQPNDDDNDGLNLGSKTPKTGDENNLLLWACLAVLGMVMILTGASKALKQD